MINGGCLFYSWERLCINVFFSISAAVASCILPAFCLSFKKRNPCRMKLKMVIGNKVIDSVTVTSSKLNNREYIAGLRHLLEERNKTILEKQVYEPIFFIDGVPSKMNRK